MLNDPKPDPLSEYHRFVGSFITEYARLEFLLRYILEHMSGMSDASYRILVGFPRSGDVIKKVKMMAETHDISPEARVAIDDAFKHLTSLTAIRDRIVHYGGHPLTEGDVLIFMKPTTEANHDQFSQQELWNAVIDLNFLSRIILYRLGPPMPSEMQKDFSLNAIRREPWRYIPPAQPQSRQ